MVGAKKRSSATKARLLNRRGKNVVRVDAESPAQAQEDAVRSQLLAAQGDGDIIPFKELRVGEVYYIQSAGPVGKVRSIVLIDQIYPRSTAFGRVINQTKPQGVSLYAHNEVYQVPEDVKQEALAVWQKKLASGYSYSITTKGSCGGSGTDPELFVLSDGGQVIPAWKFLPEKPPVCTGVVPHWDGVQAEFTTPPHGCHQSLCSEVRQGLKQVLEAALLVDDTAKLSYKPVVEVPNEVLETAEEKHIQFGCAPSKNVYGEPVMRVDAPRQLSIRFAGCHIHQGFGPQPTSVIEATVRTMDAILGPVMTSLLRGLEDVRRRAFYGRAGEYRLPPHGLEYRVPSSAVLCHPVAWHLVFDIGRLASHMARNSTAYLWKADTETVQKAINDLDLDAALKVLKENEKLLDRMLAVLYDSGALRRYATQAKHVIFNGISSRLDVSSMEHSWQLEEAADRVVGGHGPRSKPPFQVICDW